MMLSFCMLFPFTQRFLFFQRFFFFQRVNGENFFPRQFPVEKKKTLFYTFLFFGYRAVFLQMWYF